MDCTPSVLRCAISLFHDLHYKYNGRVLGRWYCFYDLEITVSSFLHSSRLYHTRIYDKRLLDSPQRDERERERKREAERGRKRK